MKMNPYLISILAAFSLQVSVAGCVDATDEDDIESAEPSDQIDTAKADGQSISFTVLDIKPTRDATSYVKVIKSKRQYRRVFGVDPTNIDFRKEAVVVFSAGLRNTGGYKASISDIRFTSNGVLNVSAQVDAPNSDCLVTQASTFPTQTVKILVPFTPVVRSSYSVKEIGYSCHEGAGVGELCGNGVLGTPNIACADGLTCVLNDFDPPPNVQSSGPTGTCQDVQLPVSVNGEAAKSIFESMRSAGLTRRTGIEGSNAFAPSLACSEDDGLYSCSYRFPDGIFKTDLENSTAQAAFLVLEANGASTQIFPGLNRVDASELSCYVSFIAGNPLYGCTFTPIQAPAQPTECKVGGCSGEICSDQEGGGI
jgi:hypothetical protein